MYASENFGPSFHDLQIPGTPVAVSGLGDTASDAGAWMRQAMLNNDNARASILKWLVVFKDKYPNWYAYQVNRANDWHDWIAKGIQAQYAKLVAGVSGLGQAPFPASACVSFDADGNCQSYGPANLPPGYGGTVGAPSPFAGVSAWVQQNTSTVYIVAAGLFGLAVLRGGRRR